MFSSEADSDSRSGFSELSEVIGNLAFEVENAKKLSHGQLDLLRGQLQDVKARTYSLSEEKDEALRLLARVKDERDQLKGERDQFNKERERSNKEFNRERDQFNKEREKTEKEFNRERDHFNKEKDQFNKVMDQLNDEREQLKEEMEQLLMRVSFLRSNVDELEQAREAGNQALEEARREVDLTLLQLRQVQDELEHYFLLSRQQSQLLEANENLQSRLTSILANVRR